MSNGTDGWGVIAELGNAYMGEVSTARGSRFFLSDGVTEIEGVTSFNVPATGPNDILMITLTLPLVGVKYRQRPSKEEVAEKVKKVFAELKH